MANLEASKKTKPKKIQLRKSTASIVQTKLTSTSPGATTSFSTKEKTKRQLGICGSVSIKHVDEAMILLKSFHLQQHVATVQLLQFKPRM